MGLPHIKDAIELNQEIKEISAKNSKILERNAKVSAHCLMQYKLSQQGFAFSRQSPSPALTQESLPLKPTIHLDLEMIQEQSACKHSRTSSVAAKQHRDEDPAVANAHIRRMNSLRLKGLPDAKNAVISPRSSIIRSEFNLKAPKKKAKPSRPLHRE